MNKHSLLSGFKFNFKQYRLYFKSQINMKSLGLLLLIISGWVSITNSQVIMVAKKIDIYLQVKFMNKGATVISYLDSNYRYSSVKLVNRKEGDTILVRKVTTDKPTVFTISELINGRVYSQLYIGFNNADTISFEMNSNKITYIGKDKRNYIINEIFGKIDVFNHKKFTINEFPNQQIIIEKERLNHLNTLTYLISLYPIDTSSIQTIKNLIDLNYYNDLFYINYSGVINKNWVNPYFNKFDSIEMKTKMLNSLSSQFSTSIMSNLIQYGAYLNKSQNTDLLDNVQYLSPRFFKTKCLDGFLLNYIEVKTYDERERVLAKLKNFMLGNSDSFEYTKKMIGNEVYNASFISFDNKKVTLKDFLTVDKKIIVLDFWASWCAPCVAEIPKLKSVTKKLIDINFISISLDKDPTKWIEACNKYDMKHDSFRVLTISNNELIKYFGISSIPRFIVMTNKGEVLSDDFFRPSDAKFESDLKKITDVY